MRIEQNIQPTKVIDTVWERWRQSIMWQINFEIEFVFEQYGSEGAKNMFIFEIEDRY